MEMDIAKFNETLVAELFSAGRKEKHSAGIRKSVIVFQDMPLDAEQMDKVFHYPENNGIDITSHGRAGKRKPRCTSACRMMIEINLEEEEEVDI